MLSGTAPLTSFLAGRWHPPHDRVIDRENPGRTAETAVRWCPADPAVIPAALDHAAAGAIAWADYPIDRRARLLQQLLDDVASHAPALAAVITRENGKLRREAEAEVAAALADARHALLEANPSGVTEPAPTASAGIRSTTYLEPLGVCLVITPWNFPLATILRKIVPALLFGNAVVVKPSEFTCGTAVALFQLIARLPLPPGTATLVLGHGAELGPALATHPAVRAISFTGSTTHGLSLARLTAAADVRLQLEMGGKNSLVVLADADLARAVEAAVIGGFGCAGQWCTGTGRVIVEQPIHDDFVEQLAARAAELRPGPGDEPGSSLAPVISAARVQFAAEAVRDTLAAGARVAGRVEAPPSGGHFVAATVLAGVREEMACFTDELFVPVLPVASARNEADALRLANAGRLGLSASVFSRDADRALALARRVEAGMVHVNLHTAYREPALPVAGWRDSGRGIPECGRFARDFYTRARACYVRP